MKQSGWSVSPTDRTKVSVVHHAYKLLLSCDPHCYLWRFFVYIGIMSWGPELTNYQIAVISSLMWQENAKRIFQSRVAQHYAVPRDRQRNIRISLRQHWIVLTDACCSCVFFSFSSLAMILGSATCHWSTSGVLLNIFLTRPVLLTWSDRSFHPAAIHFFVHLWTLCSAMLVWIEISFLHFPATQNDDTMAICSLLSSKLHGIIPQCRKNLRKWQCGLKCVT